jgi:hypothetical protein
VRNRREKEETSVVHAGDGSEKTQSGGFCLGVFILSELGTLLD